MNEILQTPFFGIVCSLLAFEFALWLQKKTKLIFLNPLLMAILCIILFLSVFQIDLSNYQIGGDMINFFLGPVTVVLAIPLYQQLQYLKQYAIPILFGILIGTIVGVISIVLVASFFQFETQMIASLLAKSVTTPIGIEITNQLGGIPAITILNILVTGMIGSLCAEGTCRFFRIKHPIAKGVAIGTSAHALGTTKALEMGEMEGAMSSLAIGIAGIVTVVVAPFIWSIFMG